MKDGEAAPVRVLVWQWGRFGAGPRFAVELAEGLRALPGVEPLLSMSNQSELLRGARAPKCELPVATFAGRVSFVRRVLAAPWMIGSLTRRLRGLAPDFAICAQPGMLDFIMAAALRRVGVPFIVLVHDADAHPGDGLPLLMWLQRRLCRRAAAVACLSTHVGARLRALGLVRGPLIVLRHPPVGFGAAPPVRHDGPLRLLHFGRLLPYKGLDLLAEALALLGGRTDLVVRIAGSGPETPQLDALRALPGVVVENRWVPEDEVGTLLSWSDALVLPYREASQSGVAAAALAAGRAVVATNVGGLAEQLAGAPCAILCEPTAPALAQALHALIEHPMAAPSVNPDPSSGWREMAETLVRHASAAGLCRAG